MMNFSGTELHHLGNFSSLLSGAGTLQHIIDNHSLVVGPETPLRGVILQMNQGTNHCAVASPHSEQINISNPRVDYALVMAHQQLLGIFTERDVVRLSAQGVDFAEVKIADVMTRQLITLNESEFQDTFTVLDLFRQYHIRHLPILDAHSEVVGVITAESIREALDPSSLLKMRSINEVMSADAITASPNSSIVEVAQLMTTHQISCVVIVQSEGQLSPSMLSPIGIITERDIVQFQTLELDLTSLQAQSVMSSPLVCLAPEDPLLKAYQTMQQLHVRRLVIADAQGKLAGILTQINMLAVLNSSEMYSTVEILQQQVERLQSEKINLLETLNANLEHQVQADAVAIQTYKERFQSTFEQAAVGMAHVDLQGQFLCVNQRFCDLVGYSESELKGKTFFDINHSENRELDERQIQRLIHGEISSFTQENRYARGAGSILWGSFTVSLAYLSSGESDYLIVVLEDISERKRVEAALLNLNQDLESRVVHSTTALQSSENRFRLAFEEAAIGMALIAPDGRWLRVNRAICNIVGYSKSELLKMDFQTITHPDTLEQDLSYVQQMLSGETDTCQLEKRYIHKQGYSVWVLLSVSLVRDEQNQPLYFISQIQDITERRRAEKALFQEKELAQVTLQSIGDAVITTDIHGNINKFNVIAEHLTGWSPIEAKGRFLTEVFQIIHEDTRNPAPNPVHRALQEGRIVGLENHIILISRDGTEYAIEDSAAPIRDRQGHVIGTVLVFHDVTQSRNLTHQLSWQASHDPLTNLVNRRKFDQVLHEALDDSLSSGAQHVLCFLDLDQFKVINDTCGHAAGDELLCQVAKLMQKPIRAADTLARLGGDEFGILLHQCPLDRAKIIAEQLRRTIQTFRFQWENKVFGIGVSIGLAQINSQDSDIEDILGAADAACYTAKARGRNRIQVYEPNDSVLLQQRGEQWWSVRIKQAIEEDRFCLYGQTIIPTISSSEHKTTACEILLRMVNEQGEVISASEFIPAAEHYHLNTDIDRWVIRKFLRENRTKFQPSEEQVNSPPQFMINLSGGSVGDEQFLQFLKTQLKKHPNSAKQICFEITETAAISNLSQAVCFMQDIKRLGCQFALDDFGTGMSSFAYLKTLPVDYLKIDGHFIEDMVNDPATQAIVESINHIGHVMGMQTIAEYVSSVPIREKLQNIGVDYIQGYSISKPAALKF